MHCPPSRCPSSSSDHRGTESKPHSRPCMTFLEIVTSQGKQEACGGFLIRRDFVLTAAHSAGTFHLVLTRVCNSHHQSHNRKQKEDTWQRLEVITNVLVAGWGKTDVKEPASSTLQDVELRIVEPRVCSLFPAFDHNLHLCVGHPQSTKFAFKSQPVTKCETSSLRSW
ncbi:hypothetical protein FD754_025304, partial [Muntiacus muntjak]